MRAFLPGTGADDEKSVGKQELKIKQMTTDIADMIEKDTAVPQRNDGIF